MASNEEKIEKKKVAINRETYEKLKDFSRFNGLKLRLVVDTMVELLGSDEALSQKVVSVTLSKQEDDTAK